MGSGKQLAVLKGHNGEVTSVVFSPDGKLLATDGRGGYYYTTARIWDTSGKQLAVLKADQDVDWSVVFSPDGKLLATGGNDGTARIWDTSGKQLAALKGEQGTVNSVVFSPNSKLLATGGEDGTARLWQVGGLDEILAVSCDWVGNYVKRNPNVTDHTLCDDAGTRK
ncbi:hypothetical protein G7B40_018035 [Aetokthonos hydrillicola Thurmond2011]|jgi:WD40 repeat protein|uniref:Anaphase-promoting complex subunit 4 WD40 domain-containing protein n=1 Tax=Aetokthonos hydrillicola Thurmond2011 TaxID=2712845 RepID=A0AAP5ICE4_9CYAN|nr:hypothetical protein [Aetokthonos hydrillicola]MBO3460396.1 hypothetical protein [Aetokthonos hydrillicola CCALA 1050]MBW4584482.1 hypothetical protein [Aetokthonos hydrillicola CCALA 1050]MDR9896445.1 hypothetical protein [Aetokthonos hydrillicola Thurmond2011]